MTADEETAEKADGENGDGGMTTIWDEEKTGTSRPKDGLKI
jgi:hypothetical protein